MILSMTGFAAVATELPGCSLSVELRSVNHRYLDLQFRLPDELRAMESAVRELLSTKLKRGKVDCRIALNRTAPGAATLAVNADRVIQLRDAAAEVARQAPGTTPLSTVEILRWPGVLAEPTVDPDTIAAQALALTRQALRDLSSSREREGQKLREMLDENCRQIEMQVARVGPRVPAIHEAYVEKLSGRLREAGLDPDTERLKQELA